MPTLEDSLAVGFAIAVVVAFAYVATGSVFEEEGGLDRSRKAKLALVVAASYVVPLLLVGSLGIWSLALYLAAIPAAIYLIRFFAQSAAFGFASAGLLYWAILWNTIGFAMVACLLVAAIVALVLLLAKQPW